MYINKHTLCDDILYIRRKYNDDTGYCSVLAHNLEYRFILNPFGGVDFYKVDEFNDVIPIGNNLHKETIKRFLMKYNDKTYSWNIMHSNELGLS